MGELRWFGAGVVVTVVVGMAVVSAGQQPQPGMSPARFFVQNKTRAEAVPVTLVAVDRTEPAPVVDVRLERLPPVDLTPATIAAIANAQQPSRRRWEYQEIIVDRTTDRQQAMATAGSEGWEAVSMVWDQDGNKLRVLLKRPR